MKKMKLTSCKDNHTSRMLQKKGIVHYESIKFWDIFQSKAKPHHSSSGSGSRMSGLSAPSMNGLTSPGPG